MLKQHLDQFVVDQERAKKVLSTAVYNHYQRIQELERQEDEHVELMAKEARREMASRHPIEGISTFISDDGFDRRPLLHHHYAPTFGLIMNPSDEFPGQQSTTYQQSHTAQPSPPPPTQPQSQPSKFPLKDPSSSPTLEKSNILLFGPSGVGKTLMAKTLARILDVPFSMSDCTPLTSSGYIGEDVEVVVQRLLAASNYDVGRAEKGIIALDEIDKLSSVKVSHGKDVGGEGVQQALLKIVEGTTVTVQAKSEKTSTTTGRERDRGGFPAPGPGTGGNASQGGKNEVYSVRTDNILFICTGAFIGLHKLVLERIAKGSIGFNAPVRAAEGSRSGTHDTTIQVDSSNAELFKEHLPFWNKLNPNTTSPYTHSPTPLTQQQQDPGSTTLNTLDLVTPADLQKYGLIPNWSGASQSPAPSLPSPNPPLSASSLSHATPF